ncbi:MAG: amidophosphoribosyltransferase [Phycisphaerae bacterium]|nr:amidophosphoribosyltransferase [Phycisphaerae bacterium]
MKDAREFCGLFGVWGDPDAAMHTYQGLYALQHRGQESAGMCVSDRRTLRRYAATGLVTEVFKPGVLAELSAPAAIGHVRYSTTGSCHDVNAQPLLIQYSRGQVAVAHNGNLVNAALLRHEYEDHGAIFQTTSDTEVILHLLAHPRHLARPDPLAHVLTHLQGAYCLLLLYPDRIEAVRDPFGLRPLVIGRLPSGAYCAASETCALDLIEAEFVREVQPGEIVTLSDAGISGRYFASLEQTRRAYCIFEQVYFADPSSNVFGQNVHLFRVATGRRLADEAPADADLVIPVPNAARCAALGYSERSGHPLGRGFTTNHYAGRSFIMPTQANRDLVVRMKLNVIRESVRGKRLVVVEDSVVRGTTTRGKIGALRRAGATEIHLRVASPPIRHPCYFGIDFPDPNELVAKDRGVKEIAEFLEVDSLAYLSLEGMLECAKHAGGSYCTACFSGEYPISVDRPVSKFMLERYQLPMFP